MKKIPTLFKRDEHTGRITEEATLGLEYILEGTAVPTVKYDGTCCLVSLGKMYKRYEVKRGGKAPVNFEPANPVDPNTGKQQGWVPVGDGPEDKYHRDAFNDMGGGTGVEDGTYELVGPKIQGNPEGMDRHRLIYHGREVLSILSGSTLSYQSIKSALSVLNNIEGVVWWKDGGPVAKVKLKDFGFKRAPSTR